MTFFRVAGISLYKKEEEETGWTLEISDESRVESSAHEKKQKYYDF